MQISRRQWLAGGLGSAAGPGLRGAAAARPNFVFLFSDDHHYQCFGAMGNPHIRTPHLDQLAARGITFTNGAISTPQCAPSRGVLLSGLESFQSGLLSNGQTRFREEFGPAVPEQLRRAGYDTVMVGKWHIRNTPRECGFARAPLWLPGGSSRYVDPALRRGLEGAAGPVRGHITDLFTDAAIDSLRNATRPFFLWLSYNAPHTPWHAAERYRIPYEGKEPGRIAPPNHPAGGREFDWITYYAVISHLDEACGRLISELERSGLWENTLVVFLGDNGFMCGSKGLNGKVVPWEESVRVPFAAAGGMVPRGLRVDAPVASIDLPATWLEMAGVKPAYPLAGRSLRRLLTTGEGGPDVSFAVWDDGRPEGLATRRAVEPYRAARNRSHKLIVWESGRQALYDWQSDPAEERNLIGEPAAARARGELAAKLARRLAETSDRAAKWLAARNG
jgi:arylsulfatase A-like enzyme